MKRNEPIQKFTFSHDFHKIAAPHVPVNRPHSRQKRYAEAFNNVKSPISISDRKTRKRRTSDKIGVSIVSLNFNFFYP